MKILGVLSNRVVLIMASGPLLAICVMYLMGWGAAVPWGFGGWVEENKSGRVPEFDKFLKENAEVLGDEDKVKELLPKFIELTKQIRSDSECTQYYTTVLMRVADLGLNAAMANERETVNSKMARSMTQRGGESLSYAMKMRHILDAYVDAAALHAWPHLKHILHREL